MVFLFHCAGYDKNISSDEITTTFLSEGWELFPSVSCKAEGEKISTHGFVAKTLVKTFVPKTVLGALVDAKVYQDE